MWLAEVYQHNVFMGCLGLGPPLPPSFPSPKYVETGPSMRLRSVPNMPLHALHVSLAYKSRPRDMLFTMITGKVNYRTTLLTNAQA